MNQPKPKSGTVTGMRESFKKATVEMLILHLLSSSPMYVYQMIQALETKSGGHYTVSTLYPAIYRLMKFGYIAEHDKMVSEDNRLRRYYAITEEGYNYVVQLKKDYQELSRGVQKILKN